MARIISSVLLKIIAVPPCLRYRSNSAGFKRSPVAGRKRSRVGYLLPLLPSSIEEGRLQPSGAGDVRVDFRGDIETAETRAFDHAERFPRLARGGAIQVHDMQGRPRRNGVRDHFLQRRYDIARPHMNKHRSLEFGSQVKQAENLVGVRWPSALRE